MKVIKTHESPEQIKANIKKEWERVSKLPPMPKTPPPFLPQTNVQSPNVYLRFIKKITKG